MNKKTDEELARELDAVLTAKLKGQPVPPVAQEIMAEVNLAGQLTEIAAGLEADPLFLSRLEARLAAAARQAQKREALTTRRPERAPFWQDIIRNIKETLTMKRTLFALGATMALFVIAFFAWSTFQGGQAVEPGASEVAVVPTIEPTLETTIEPTIQPSLPATMEATSEATPEPTPDIAALPTLPSLASASGLGGGFGGGGGGEGAAASEGMVLFTNPLSGTEFILNASLPTEPVVASAYAASDTIRYSLEDATRLAGLFGFSGPAYVETFYQEPGSEWTPSVVYQFFDGTRQLAVGDRYFSYFENGIVTKGSASEPMAYAESVPIAEAFLQERGLLDFPYRTTSQSGFDVAFHRIIDGQEAVFPELQVTVSRDGGVISVFRNEMGNLTALGGYPLRTAADAWQLLQEQGVDFRQVFFSTRPGPDFVLPEPPAGDEAYRSWQREYAEGQSVNMYPYPTVFLPADAASGAAPRIVIDWFVLTGPADQLWAIAEHVGQPIHLTGTFHNTAAGLTIELGSWEALENPVEYTFREGTVTQSGRDTLLVVSESESYIIPDAPKDLAEGEKIYVSGWIEAPVGSTTPSIFEWNSMGVIFEEQPQTEVMPADGFVPYRIGQVTIEKIDLIYAVMSIYDEETESLSYVYSPAWHFSGTTDTKEIIDIYVQAVEDALVAPTPVG